LAAKKYEKSNKKYLREIAIEKGESVSDLVPDTVKNVDAFLNFL
jgi:hypothetical protein